MDLPTYVMPIIVVAFGLFAGAMYAYRKITVKEPFKVEKFLPTMGIGALAALVVAGAGWVLPNLGDIFAQIEQMAPGGVPSITVIIAAILAVYNRVSKGDNILPPFPTYVKPSDSAAPVTSEWSPGFTVTPTEMKGVSPFAALLTIVVGNDPKSVRCNVRIDWQDGTPAEDFIPDQTSGQVVVSHAYVYAQGMSKYSGHAFYPKFTVLGKDGKTYGDFNVVNKCCTIEVQSR